MTKRRLICMICLLAAAAFWSIPSGSQSPLDKLKKTVDKAKQKATEISHGSKGPQPTSNTQPAPGEQSAAGQPPAPGQQQGQGNTATASGGGTPGASGEAATAPAHAGSPTGSGGSLPFTTPMVVLMTMRDIPQYFEESHLAGFATQQISIEKTEWQNLGPHSRDGRNYPPQPQITYEWAKLVDQNPKLANGALMDVFLRSDPDWSFLDNAPGWDPNANQSAKPVVAVFLFAKESIEGRQPEFAAHELAPVVKRQFEVAIKKLPTHFSFTVMMPTWKYDFAAKGIRFQNPTNPNSEKIDLLVPMWAVNKAGVRQWSGQYPAKAQAMGVYAMGGAYEVVMHEPPEQVNRGLKTGLAPEFYWKRSFSAANVAEPGLMAFDRRLQISTIPLDTARAERITKVGGVLTARIYFTAERIELEHPTTVYDHTVHTLLYAKFEKAEISARNGEIIATYGPQDFHAAF